MVDHDPADVADQRRSEHVRRMQRRAIEVVAAVAPEVVVGIEVHLLAGSPTDLLLEAALVDDHVHQWHRARSVGGRGGRSYEDGVEGVSPALRRGPDQVADERTGTEPLACFGPVGEELGPFVAIEDLAHHRALHRPE